jgi:predicted membrane channel-forming protein YqfA (hemolysin III family)
MIHNETVNIWSHFIGAMFFVFMVGYVIINMPPSTNLEEAGLG